MFPKQTFHSIITLQRSLAAKSVSWSNEPSFGLKCAQILAPIWNLPFAATESPLKNVKVIFSINRFIILVHKIQKQGWNKFSLHTRRAGSPKLIEIFVWFISSITYWAENCVTKRLFCSTIGLLKESVHFELRRESNPLICKKKQPHFSIQWRVEIIMSHQPLSSWPSVIWCFCTDP